MLVRSPTNLAPSLRSSFAGCFAPIHIYPLYENALAHKRSQSTAKNIDESAELYAEFAKNSEKIPTAWNYGSKKSKEEIKVGGKGNRMICWPCGYPGVERSGVRDEIGVLRERKIWFCGTRRSFSRGGSGFYQRGTT